MRLTFFVVIAALVSTPAFAQRKGKTTPTPTPGASTPTPTPKPPSTVHDLPENDPSKGPHLRLKKEISQFKLLYSPIGGALFDAIDNSFNEARARYRFSKKVRKSVLDPALQKLWKIHSHRYAPQKDIGPSFINTDEEYAGISDIKFGNCWGLATLIRYFNVLAFFDPALKKNTDPREDRRLIQSVLSGEATVIPGYANFREFSLEPHNELTLKVAALELWRSRAARGGSIKIFKRASEPLYADPKDEDYGDEVEALLKDLETRIGRGEQPKITMSSIVPLKESKVFGVSGDIHVMPVYKVERINGKEARIYAWDINFYAETMEKKPKVIEIDANRALLYEPWYDKKVTYAVASALVRVEIAPENDTENAQMLRSLKKFCAKSEHAQYCVENSPY